jgi:uncharacterized protein
MVKVRFIKNKDGFIRKMVIKGHAGFDKKGRDIVCAAVSVTAYTAVGALEELAKLDSKSIYNERDGYMVCDISTDIPDDKKHDIDIIMKTTVVGMKQIELTYGKDYVSVFEEEV